MVGFKCSRCVNGDRQGKMEVRKEIEIDREGNVECVNKFCYFGDMTGSGGGTEEALRVVVRCGLAKFRERF